MTRQALGRGLEALIPRRAGASTAAASTPAASAPGAALDSAPIREMRLEEIPNRSSGEGGIRCAQGAATMADRSAARNRSGPRASNSPRIS